MIEGSGRLGDRSADACSAYALQRVNQEVENYLRMFITPRQSDWAEWLATAEFAYNNREHSSTKQSPFFLNYG